MDQPAQTLHDFVLNLLSDPQSLEAFQSDPQGALSGAGLSDLNASDVHEIAPLVMDYMPMHQAHGFGNALGELPTGSMQGGQQEAIDQLQQLAHAFSFTSTGDGFQGAFDYTDAQADSHGAGALAAGLTDGVNGAGAASSPLGADLFHGTATPDGLYALGNQYAVNPLDAQGVSSLAGGPDQGAAGGSAFDSPFGTGAFSGSGTPAGEFTGATSYASQALGGSGSGGFAGSLADGFTGDGSYVSPLGNGDFTAANTSGGDFANSSSLASDTFDSTAASAFSGNLADGFSGGGQFDSPLGEGNLAGAGTTDGDFAGHTHLANDALGGSLAGAAEGNFTQGLDLYGQLGGSDMSLALPGAEDFSSPNLSSSGLEHSFSDGSNTVASALANPAASGDPADALNSLFGNAPTIGDTPAPSVDFAPANPLGNAPALGGALPHAPAAGQNPAGQVSSTVQNTVHQVTDQAHLPGTAGHTPSVAQHPGGQVADQVGATVHHTVNSVTDHLHSGAAGVVPQAPSSDPSQAVHSVTSSVTDHVSQGASQSPIGGDNAGVSYATHHVTDALQHHSLNDTVHDVGHGLDLHM